jgi:type II secretory ATPase GspE/PulE/Tfp pilus assembly ATPase PilB-like protein
MSTKPARSVVSITEICPNCKGEMTISEVTPVLFADGVEDVTYRCKGCCSEMKRTFKRRSGAWQLIRYTPEFPHFNDIARFRKPVEHLRDHRFAHLRSGSTRDK